MTHAVLRSLYVEGDRRRQGIAIFSTEGSSRGSPKRVRRSAVESYRRTVRPAVLRATRFTPQSLSRVLPLLTRVAVVASFFGGWGHAEPLVEVAAARRAEGPRRDVRGQRAVLPRLEALAFDHVVVGPDTLSAKRIPLQPVDRALERTVMREHFVGRYGRQRAASLTTLLHDTIPAALICDEVDFGALLAAELLGIPSVTLNVIAAGRVVSPGVIGEAWNALRGELGLDPDPDGIHLGGTLALAPFPASFRDPTLPRLPQWRPVCPTTIPAARTDRRGAPLVYATLGTVFNFESETCWRGSSPGLGMTDVDALVNRWTQHTSASTSSPPASSRVRIETVRCKRDVLGRCEVFLCHGGSER